MRGYRKGWWSRGVLLALSLGLLLGGGGAVAETPPEASSLDALLERVKRGWRAEREENQRREAAFREARSEQRRLLDEAKRELAQLERHSRDLSVAFDENEITISNLQDLLAERLGNFGELFGVVRQVAGDAAAQFELSLVSAELPADRIAFLRELGQTKSLPTIEKLERLWRELLQEMIEQGAVSRFLAAVVTRDGEAVEDQEVVRVGAFNALLDGRYLNWHDGVLGELVRQPAGRYLATAQRFGETQGPGLAPLAIDPSRGAILSLLVREADTRERVEQGGLIGYAIITLGIATALFGLARLGHVLLMSRRVHSQRSHPRPDAGDPLGRVVAVYEENRDTDTDTLERKLDEAILREAARMERFLWLVKVVSVVAPLMGLLGTVTGMIKVFQVITLFGAGNVQQMAGGISEALVTTMLGLCVAIPLILLHSVMHSASRGVVDVLEEQGAGLVARRTEQELPAGAPA